MVVQLRTAVSLPLQEEGRRQEENAKRRALAVKARQDLEQQMAGNARLRQLGKVEYLSAPESGQCDCFVMCRHKCAHKVATWPTRMCAVIGIGPLCKRCLEARRSFTVPISRSVTPTASL